MNLLIITNKDMCLGDITAQPKKFKTDLSINLLIF